MLSEDIKRFWCDFFFKLYSFLSKNYFRFGKNSKILSLSWKAIKCVPSKYPVGTKYVIGHCLLIQTFDKSWIVLPTPSSTVIANKPDVDCPLLILETYSDNGIGMSG